MASGDLEGAEALCRKRLAADDADAAVHVRLASLCGRSGRWQELRHHIHRALELDPEDAQAHNLLGIGHREAGEREEALTCFRRALAIRPAYAAALNNLGIALQEQEDWPGAIEAYRQAIALQPDCAEAHSNLGHCLERAGQSAPARSSLERALALRPDLADAHNNLGHLLLAEGQLDAAIAFFSRAIEIRSDHGAAHLNRAQALLLAGDYPRGWADYEWRLGAVPPVIRHQPTGSARWEGGALAAGQELLLVAEQGLGDTLQFVRYVPQLRRQGIPTRLCAPRELHGILQASGIEAHPLPPEEGESHRAGPWLPLLSLPGILGVSPDHPLATEPYLRVPPDRLERWRQRLTGESRPLVAIAWQGNPLAERNLHRGRSLPLQSFAVLAERSEVTFLSLQKGFGAEQRQDCSFRHRFACCQEEVDATWDFLDAAALLACCDLVITSDTALAHLSGGMGHPTWLLLQHVPDWRWGLEGDTSFWYPSLRLFRQRSPGDWDELLARVADELGARAEGPNRDPAADTIAALIERGEIAQAEELCRQRIAGGSLDPRILTSLAGLCGRSGRWPELRDLVRQALALDPADPQAHNHLGVALRQEGDLDAAIASYRRALTHKPGYAAAHNNLAIALQERGDLGQAADHYRQAIALQPDLANAHANLGVLLLLQGQYATGWAEYGWRHAMADAGWGLHVRPHTPPWDGRSLQPGETLLLVCEQGLGDTLQFMRYAPHLRRQGIAVRLCAQPPLHGLIRASAIDPAPIAPAQVDPDRADPWLPLLSLPGILGVSAANPLVREPYLHPPPERLERWRQRLADESRPLVALTWQGNPVPERSTLRGRSLPLETFAPLAVACGGTFLSLQKGFGAEQLESCSFRDRFARCQDEVSATWDFLDAAAILACCDLVISSDTALAHLAGGLGLPTWLLLRDLPDWRWGLEGDASFWYPSLRLFRQRRRGDWDEVIDRVAGALGALPERKPAPDPGEPARRGEPILAPISLGELIDKITILEIKEERLQGPALAHVRQELAALRNSLATLDLRVEARRIEALRRINAQLWDIEDAIREHERRQDFGDSFVQLARSVYQQNDRRAAIKREINTAYGSALIEEKSYSDYGADPLDKGGEPAQVQYELGCALLAQGDVEAAVAALERALALRPEFPEAHLDLGNARQAQGLLPAAMACFRAAERQRPAYAEARLNLALAQLLSGDYAAGLENYEWRFRTHGSALLVAVPELEPWRGEPLPAGESLLLVAEQGLGDTLQFMRYALPLRERGLAVRLCAPARLHGLIRASGIDPDPLTAERIGSLRSGRWLPLLSLPGQLGVRPDRPLRSEPYLRTDPILREKWRGILAGEGQPVIGLHWQGNPAQEHNHGRGRSLPLEAFAPLAGIEGIRLLSLQKGSGSEQLAACSFRDRFVSCQPAVDEIWDFEETAAIVAACDLVITSDSALAHLAGGLGHPTWLLLKDVPEWRWGLEGETSFWYPSLRLFRQRQRGDWAAVLARVADELAALLALQALLAPPPLMGGGPL